MMFCTRIQKAAWFWGVVFVVVVVLFLCFVFSSGFHTCSSAILKELSEESWPVFPHRSCGLQKSRSPPEQQGFRDSLLPNMRAK